MADSNTVSANSVNVLLNISSVVNDKLDTAKFLGIVSRWKDSKGKDGKEEKIVSPANRVRFIELPKDIWHSEIKCEVIGNADATNLLSLHIHDSLVELAKSYLTYISEESNMLRKEVPLSQFTLPSLLNWQAEQAAISGRLNGDEIKKWLAESATIKSVTAAHSAEIGKALGEQFVKLASPNHGLTPEKAGKILASLWNADDTDSTTGLRVQMRLTAISKKVETSAANVLDSIL